MSAPSTPRRSTGVLGALKKAKQTLRPSSLSVAVLPFFSQTKTLPARPKLEPELPADSIVGPAADAATPSSLGHKPEKNIAVVTKGASTAAHGAGLFVATRDAEAARAHMRGLFKTASAESHATRDALTDALSRLPVGGEGGKALEHAILFAEALAHVTQGDVGRAHALLQSLGHEGTPADPAVAADQLALRISLANTEIGLRTLLSVHPHGMPALPDDSGADDHTVQREAYRQSLRAAGQLLNALPADVPRPHTLEGLRALANAVLPRTEQIEPPPAHLSGDHLKAYAALSKETLAAKALLAGLQLAAAPQSDPPQHLRAAYFAWRNNMTREGRGTDLSKTRQRMFKLLKYADRAAKPSLFSGFAGRKKSPLSAVNNLGTVGLTLRDPTTEFAKTAVIGQVTSRLRDRLPPHGTQATRVQIRQAVKLAALEHWQAKLQAKGWRDDVKFGKSDRKAIVARVQTMLGSNLPALHQHAAAAAEELPVMNADVLSRWAAEAGLPDDGERLGDKLRLLQELRDYRDIRAKGRTPEAQLDMLHQLIDEMPDTYDVRMTSGGTYGVGGAPGENLKPFSPSPVVPSVGVLPDIGHVRGRHAVVDVGSNAQFGHVFVGTDSRQSTYAGIGGFAGWGVHKHVLVGLFAGGRIGHDSGGPAGATIRVRRHDSEAPDRPDPWRAKLNQVLSTLRSAGPGEGRPVSAEQMWSGLADRFYKDADVSISWDESKTRSTYVSGSIGLTARVGTDHTKIGPSLSAGHQRVLAASSHRVSKTGAYTSEVATHSSGRATTVSASLVESVPAIPVQSEHAPHLASVQTSSLPYLGVGTTLGAAATNAALRIARENGRVVPEHTYRDTEFGTFKEFKAFVDHHNDAWKASLGGDDAAQDKLNKYLAKVNFEATSGSQIMGQRDRLSDQAGEAINFRLGLLDKYERSPRPLSPEEASRAAALNHEIGEILNDPASWRHRALYVLEAVGADRTIGLSYLLNAQRNQQVSGVRELSALGATHAS